ncbi:MAG TPA: molecular chaperone DnaK, partial [Gemmataceae bacterium]|nr:molecular chaperone DnaK [Gemmataceae bacterium]
DRQAIQAAVERTKQAASGEDVQAIRQAVSDLQAAAHAMAQHTHRPSGDGTAPGAGGEGKGKDDVIDAEFEVKK